MEQVTDRPTLLQEFALRARNAELEVTVPSYGPFQADTAIVGEGAGEQDVRQKMPFVGGAGSTFWTQANKVGLRRHECYLTYVVKRQIAVSKENEKLSVSKGELHTWGTLLRWELSQLPNLRYVIVCGNMALKALCGLDGVSNWRGSVLDVAIGNRTVKAIVCLSPAHVLKDPKFEAVLGMDLKKASLVRSGQQREHKVIERINPTLAEALAWIDKMRNEKKPCAYDIETINGHVACYGLANDPHEGMCIALRTATENIYTPEQEAQIMLAMQGLFDDPDVEIVVQNGTFDGYYSWYKDGLVIKRPTREHAKKKLFDTLLGHHTLYPLLPHSLGFIVSQYTWHPYYKDEGKDWRHGGTVDDFWRYNVKDVALTIAVRNAIEAELKAQGLWNFFQNHVMQLQPHTVRSTAFGIRFDVEHRDTLREELEAYLAKLKADFQLLAFAATGNDERFSTVNPSSPDQLKELFFAKLKLVGRGNSTDAKNRAKILDNPSTPEPARKLIAALNLYAKEQKFVSTYVNVRISPDGRIRSEYKQQGTAKAPGRLSSSGLLDGTGTNLQNQPERAHKLFLADDGCGFGYFDLSQAEARVVGWIAGITKWIEDFERARLEGNFDCHRSLAADMWKMPYDEVPTEDRDKDGNITLRFTAKRCRHGLNYRMGPDRLAETTGLPFFRAVEAYNIYHGITPELMVWWKSLEEEVRTSKQLWSPMGRRLVVMQRIDDTALESIVAFKPQSTVGDKVCQVWYKSERDEAWPEGCRIALNVHDALICHGPVERIPDALRIMKRYAEEPIPITDMNGVTRELIIPADLKVSVPDERGVHTWASLKKFKL